jgi:hypothetical protein
MPRLTGEHEQGLGKLARGSVGAMGGRQRLSTAASGSPEGGAGSGGDRGFWALCRRGNEHN